MLGGGKKIAVKAEDMSYFIIFGVIVLNTVVAWLVDFGVAPPHCFGATNFEQLLPGGSYRGFLRSLTTGYGSAGE